MIFGPELVRAILTGKKTQTRRVVKGEETCRYRTGRTYALQRGRGRRAEGRIEVTRVHTQMLHAIDDTDAQREGFGNVAEFLGYWVALHGSAEDRLVWVISFTLATEAPLYLARPVPGRRGDYTRIRKQAIDELPVVDPGQLVDESDLNYMLLSKYVGWEPEDVLADAPQFSTTEDIKRLRRALDQRGIDGLPTPSEATLERTLAFMVQEGRSVRDVARALDCSVGQAHKKIRDVVRSQAA